MFCLIVKEIAMIKVKKILGLLEKIVWEIEKVLELIDKRLTGDAKADGEQSRALFWVALLCLREDPKERPTMRWVVNMLKIALGYWAVGVEEGASVGGAKLDPESLVAKKGYYSTHTSQDGDDGPTQTNIDRCDDDIRDIAKECDNIFESAKVVRNENYRLRHMYKNMKKIHRGTHLESLVWNAAKSYKKTDMNIHLDQLKKDNLGAYECLLKEPFEHWPRSQFDFTPK
ncbi:hypothetical protein GIB67_026626, partial [Kingdonia uniflora]